MIDLNDVVVMGRLTKDCETIEKNGTVITRFSIAVNKLIKKNDKYETTVIFIDNLAIFGKEAENCKKFLVKGRRIVVKGSIDINNWEKDGVKHSDLFIRVSNIFLLDLPGKSSENSNIEIPEDIDFENTQELYNSQSEEGEVYSSENQQVLF